MIVLLSFNTIIRAQGKSNIYYPSIISIPDHIMSSIETTTSKNIESVFNNNDNSENGINDVSFSGLRTNLNDNEGLLEVSQKLIEKGAIRLSGDVIVKLYNKSGQLLESSRDSDAQTLLNIASNKQIFIFIHGFELEQWGGKPRASKIEKTWKNHLQLLTSNQDIGPFAVILARHNTLDGFGDHQPQIGNILFAIRWLTDDSRLYNKERQITMVGHSAGGNYAKEAYLLFRRNLTSSKVASGGRSNTQMKIMTLATPHKGTNLTLKSSAGVAFFNLIRDLLLKNDQYGERKMEYARYNDMIASRGFNQLRLYNSSLTNLNKNFIQKVKEAGNVDVISIFSRSDKVVDSISSVGSGISSFEINGLGHFDFLNPSIHLNYNQLLKAYYSGSDYFKWLSLLNNGSINVINSIDMLTPKNITVGLTPNSSPKFVTKTSKRSKRSLAIQNYLISRLILEHPNLEKELAIVADRIDAKISASKIYKKKMHEWWGQWNGEPIFHLYRIDHLSDSDFYGEINKQRADRLTDEIRDTFDPLLWSVLAGVWYHEAYSLDNKYLPVFPENFKKRFDKPRFSGPGALYKGSLDYPKWVFMDIASFELGLNGGREFKTISEWGKLFHKDIWKERILLRCEYVPEDGSPHAIKPVFYWYKKAPIGWDKIPANHPLKKRIGPPRNSAPDRLADAKW